MNLDPSLYPHVVRAVIERPWAILPSTLATIVDIVRTRASGQRLSQADIQARIEVAASDQGPRRGRQRGNVAVIPMYGILMPRANLMSAMSGGTSVEQLRGSFREALADGEVDAIVFDIDSQGGQVDGIPELAAEIRAARGRKPILAQANTIAYSAAHWLASQADEFVVTASGAVGSIGVVAAHIDESKADEMDGIKTTFIHSSKYKIEGNRHQPLGTEAQAAIQHDVDAFDRMLVSDVARGRRVPMETVRSDYGEGRPVNAQDALARGMVDRIETLDETVARAARMAATQARAAAIGAMYEGLDDGATIDADEAAVLVAGPPFAERLKLVAAEVEAIAEHAHRRVELREPRGKKLTGGDREGLSRLLALRPVLDDIEALLDPGPPGATAPRRDLALDLMEAAYRGGYSLDA